MQLNFFCTFARGSVLSRRGVSLEVLSIRRGA